MIWIFAGFLVAWPMVLVGFLIYDNIVIWRLRRQGWKDRSETVSEEAATNISNSGAL